ncbi:MAG: hypothetical protein WDW36_000538 [Sanguina aurantia]
MTPQIKFMAVVAHELRNPLTPIRVAASLLIDRDVNDEASLERLQTIIDSSSSSRSRGSERPSGSLDNASKYTPQDGEIALALIVRAQTVTIIVSDNGIGISAEALPTIFELFVQDARALDHASGGLGIGLAVVRELVEAHGGSVIGQSAGSNLGSEFIVTLPLDYQP